jgi:hypothetical protein
MWEISKYFILTPLTLPFQIVPASYSAVNQTTRTTSRTRKNKQVDFSEEDGSDYSSDEGIDEYTNKTSIDTHQARQYTSPNTSQMSLNSETKKQHSSQNTSNQSSSHYLHPAAFQTPTYLSRSSTHQAHPHHRFDTNLGTQTSQRSSTTTGSTSLQQQYNNALNAQAAQQQHGSNAQLNDGFSAHNLNSSRSGISNSNTHGQTNSGGNVGGKLSLWESIKKSYHNQHLKPLYYLIVSLFLIIFSLFAILFLNRSVLHLPLIAPQPIVFPLEPILLTNGQFLTEKDILQLQKRFVTLDTLNKYQTNSTNTFTNMVSNQSKELNSKISHIQKNIPVEVDSFLENVVQLTKKFNAKHDKFEFDNYKQEVGYELMEINKLIDQLGESDKNGVKSIQNLVDDIANIQLRVEKLNNRQEKMMVDIQNATENDQIGGDNPIINKTYIQEIIKDVTITQHFSDLINNQLLRYTKSFEEKFELMQKNAQNDGKSSNFEQIPHLQNKFDSLQQQLMASVSTHNDLKFNFEQFQRQYNENNNTALNTIQNFQKLYETKLQHTTGEIETFKNTLTQFDQKMGQITAELLQSQKSNTSQFDKLYQLIDARQENKTNNQLDLQPFLEKYMTKDEFLSYIEFYLNADATGMIDYAHIGTGSTIVSSSTPFSSGGYGKREPSGTSLLPFVNLYNTKSFFSQNQSINSQMGTCVETILSKINGIGDCFTMNGRSGFVVIQMKEPIFISHFSLEHINPTIDLYPDATPRHIAFYGVSNSDRDQQREELLIEVEYRQPSGEFDQIVVPNGSNIGKEPNFAPSVQTFKVLSQLASSKPYQNIKVEVKTNYGNKDFTNLYRVRVHGKPQQGQK